MNSLKKIFLALVIFISTGNLAFASDNILQAIQIDGVKDSYNIILKSDDVAEMKKTIQAPDKMIIDLKGIKASETVNTIYNNTSSVNSVVVEPKGDDAIEILVQAPNVSNAQVNFDSLKTPLTNFSKGGNNNGDNSNAQNGSNSSGEIVLSEPTRAYRPVYNDNTIDESKFDLGSGSLTVLKQAKRLLGHDKISWAITFGLFAMLIVTGMKLIKGKDNEIRVGLSQSLKDRELAMYGSPNENGLGVNLELSNAYPNTISHASMGGQKAAGTNYGLRAYQQGTKSPYITSEIQKKKAMQPKVNPATAGLQQQISNNSAILKQQLKNNGRLGNTTAAVASRPISKTANIDSMKFLESMTKIYEKNGRADLAQGLKSNIKKAKVNV